MSRVMLPACETLKDLPDARQRPPLRVGIVLAEHFTLSALALFIDHLRFAVDEDDRSRPARVEWAIMSMRREPIRASSGVSLQPTSSLLSPEMLDYVVVVGGILHAGPQVDEITVRYLREVGASLTPLIGICTGSFVLCRAGLMTGRRSCVSWQHYQDFRQAFPDHEVVAGRLFLADGPRLTCAGGAGAAALATHLIERHLGRVTAYKASQVLLFDGPRQADGAPHSPASQSVNDARIGHTLAVRLGGSQLPLAHAIQLMDANIEEPLSLEEIAQLIAVSQRHLQRLFRLNLGITPGRYYATVRLRRARELLRQTAMPVREIAVACGYRLPCHFNRAYRAHFGYPPGRERKLTVNL